MQFSIVFAFSFALALVLASASPFDLRRTETRSPAANVESRVVKGRPAAADEVPYQVALVVTTLVNHVLETSFCGGSLIHKKWILTAAHCVYNAKSINVHFGDTDFTKTKVHCTVTYADVIPHILWDEPTGENDIALIKIPPLNDPRVKIVPLPPSNSINDTYLDEYGIVSGWGKTSDSSELAGNLQVGVMQVTNTCEESFKPFNPAYQMCANGFDGVTFCGGDSGGPFVSKSKGTQIGIVSLRGVKSCEQGVASVFTRVSAYLYWIEFYTAD